MNCLYKTPALKNYIEYLIKNYPQYTDCFSKYIPDLSEINLSIHNQDQETYELPINLPTNETVKIIWNIDSLIKYLKYNHISYFSINPYEIYHHPLMNFNDKNFLSVLNECKRNLDKKYTYKTNFIILANIPLFGGIAMIDGNHRFCCALLNSESVNACFLEPSVTNNFLQTDSFKFISVLTEINSLLHIV